MYLLGKFSVLDIKYKMEDIRLLLYSHYTFIQRQFTIQQATQINGSITLKKK